MDAIKTGNFIKDLRKEKNLTQEDLASLIFQSNKAISRWETGKGFPDLSNLEALSSVLEVSVNELLKGERDNNIDHKEENDLFIFMKETLRKDKFKNILLGFLFSLFLIVLAIYHLNSPIYIEDSNVIKIETLNDDKLIVLLNEDIAGCEIERSKDPDTNTNIITISAYKTRWHQLFNKKNESIILLGDKKDIDSIYYYPGDNNTLIYGNNDSPGLIVLPRLIYNSWILIGIIASLIGLIIYYLVKNKYYKMIILELTLIPLSFTISTLLILVGKYKEVYNASYYFSGICILALIIYALLYLFINKKYKLS